MSVSTDALMTVLFKYRGTNCSQVAAQLGMSRQALFRMIKGGTMQLPLFMRILDILDLNLDVVENGDVSRILKMSDYSGPRVRKKIKGVVYDTKKMLAIGDVVKGDTVEALCFEPVAKTYLVITYNINSSNAECIRIIDSDEKDYYQGIIEQNEKRS